MIIDAEWCIANGPLHAAECGHHVLALLIQVRELEHRLRMAEGLHLISPQEQYEREAEVIDEQLTAGQITREEHLRLSKELRRDFRDALRQIE